MNANEQTQPLGEPKEVDVVAIERELTALWKESTGSSVEGTTSPVVRACSLNLIVVTESARDLDELANMVGDVTVEHPARIFLIAANRRNGTPKLDAYISARCSLPVPGGKQVCCEQINLFAEGNEATKIPSIVTSLLVSDVPSVLLWKAHVDLHDSILQSLMHVVNRVLIDSSEDTAAEQTLLAWRSFMASHGAHTSFGDLAWTHLVSWRSIIASAFNPQDMRPLLGAMDTVTVTYSSTAVPRHSGLSQSLLLAAWLTNKLRWQILKPLQRLGTGEYTAKLRRGEQAINIHITQTPARNNFPGGIESVSIHTNGGHDLKFVATEHRDCVRITEESTAGTHTELLNVRSDKSEAVLVAQELEIVTRDAGYESVLATLTTLLKGAG